MKDNVSFYDQASHNIVQLNKICFSIKQKLCQILNFMIP